MTADPITCRIRNHKQVLGIRHADPLRQCFCKGEDIRPPTGYFFPITFVGKGPSGLFRIVVKNDVDLDSGIMTRCRGRRRGGCSRPSVHFFSTHNQGIHTAGIVIEAG